MSRPVYPFPVLSSESVDYRNNQAYKVEVSKDAEIIKIKHSLDDDSIVADFVKKGKASFSCFLSVPRTLHRKTYLCKSSELEISQKIPFPLHVSAGKVFLRPSIVSLEGLEIDNFDSLSDFYKIGVGSPIQIPKGGILGFSKWFTISSVFSKLFRIRNKPELNSKSGLFESKVSTDKGFQIVVEMGKRLYEKVAEGDPVKDYILCSALASAFTELKLKSDRKEENDPEDGLLSEAKGLRELLENKGIRTWEDEGFNPVYAASCLKPVPSDE